MTLIICKAVVHSKAKAFSAFVDNFRGSFEYAVHHLAQFSTIQHFAIFSNPAGTVPWLDHIAAKPSAFIASRLCLKLWHQPRLNQLCITELVVLELLACWFRSCFLLDFSLRNSSEPIVPSVPGRGVDARYVPWQQHSHDYKRQCLASTLCQHACFLDCPDQ